MFAEMLAGTVFQDCSYNNFFVDMYSKTFMCVMKYEDGMVYLR